MTELPFGLGQQCEQLWIVRALRQPRRQRLFRCCGATDIQIELRQVNPGGQELRLECERLDELCSCLGRQLRRTLHPVGDA